MRLRLLVPLTVGALALGLAPDATADPGGPTPYSHRISQATATKAEHRITLGSLTLRPCDVVARAQSIEIRAFETAVAQLANE